MLLAYFLGVEVCYSAHNGKHLSQIKYIKDLLSKASMQNCKGSDTRFSTDLKLEEQSKAIRERSLKIQHLREVFLEDFSLLYSEDQILLILFTDSANILVYILFNTD